MAISMLQDAQNRTALAAALAGIQQRDREVPRSLSLSPTMSANSSHSAIYPTGLPQTGIGTTPFSLIPASHLFAANRQAAVAFMAAQLPIPSLASTFFPHHPAALFGSWPTPPPIHINATQQYQQNGHLTPTQSPPASPNSPASSTSTLTSAAAAAAAATHCHENNNNEQRKGKEGMSSKLISPPINNNNNNNNNNNKPIQINGHSDGPAKKSRKLSVKKGLISPAIATTTTTTAATTTAINVSDLYGNTTAPISPPSSSSSPNSSTHEFNSPSGSGNNTITITQQRNHHDINLRDKTFTCKICSRSFGYKHVLQNHERTHTGEKPFECPECHKRFTRDHHLKTHMRLHTGEKPYHCSHCDRQFVQVANLRRHLRVHTGEKPYTCEVCEGKFSDSNQLKAHMMVHNGEKPFECERCHQKFRRRHHLINHKCELLSPISPLSSPGNANAQPHEATDDEFTPITVTNCDEKSYCVSEESFDTANNNNSNNDDKDNDDDKSNIKPLLSTLYPNTEEDENYEDVPLDLSEEGCNNNIQDLRLMYRLPASSQHVLHLTQLEMPVQTEPEDLSIRTDREKKQDQVNNFSPDKQFELNDNNNDSRCSSISSSSSSSGLIN